MIKNKIMILAIGIMAIGGTAGAQTLRTDSGPAERPPASFKGKQYIDSKGCVYIKAGFGTRVTWVPRVNRKRQLYCSVNNKPSLNAAQLAKVSGKPATRLVKPAVRTAVIAATQPVNVIPKTQVVTAKIAPVVRQQAPKRVKVTHPSDVIRSQRTVVQDGSQYNVATATTEKTKHAKTSVRGFSLFQRRQNRNSLRGNNGQDIHPADLIKSQRAAGTYQQSTLGRPAKPVVRAFDPIHKLVVYPVVIDGDITSRGNAQMALVWSNTVPMRLLQKGKLQLAASTRVN